MVQHRALFVNTGDIEGEHDGQASETGSYHVKTSMMPSKLMLSSKGSAFNGVSGETVLAICPAHLSE